MGRRCQPQSFGEVQRCYALYFVPHTQYSCSWASLTDSLSGNLRNGLGISTTMEKFFIFVPVQVVFENTHTLNNNNPKQFACNNCNGL